MFFDIGPLELVALIVLAVLIFGPDKLPKVIQDAAAFIRKVRQFSDSAKEDIRSELGPEFKDFEFDDLNPKTFARKHLLDDDELGIKEIRNTFDLRKDLTEVADAVNGKESGSGGEAQGGGGRLSLTKDGAEGPSVPAGPAGSAGEAPAPAPRNGERLRKAEPPPFDADAT
ncbi:sec-independent translocase [Streptomyces boncukensis]|uniref:Sec-independent protein translocase protein TatB n=1 Tax=Streptomyces boncukensis TaxID=2711219 RepID=A0A6G4X726_9ACTN|nr:Sec-independent protein translocase subunit TatB [Streptomyces boncukensis]